MDGNISIVLKPPSIDLSSSTTSEILMNHVKDRSNWCNFREFMTHRLSTSNWFFYHQHPFVPFLEIKLSYNWFIIILSRIIDVDDNPYTVDSYSDVDLLIRSSSSGRRHLDFMQWNTSRADVIIKHVRGDSSNLSPSHPYYSTTWASTSCILRPASCILHKGKGMAVSAWSYVGAGKQRMVAIVCAVDDHVMKWINGSKWSSSTSCVHANHILLADHAMMSFSWIHCFMQNNLLINLHCWLIYFIWSS